MNLRIGYIKNQTNEVNSSINLDAIIYFYNFESGGLKNSNPLLDYIKDHGMKILDKHKKYFSEEDIEKYKECFE